MTSNLDYRILILFVTIFLGIILLPLFMNRISKTEQHGGFFEKYYLADRKVSGIVLAIINVYLWICLYLFRRTWCCL